MPDPLIDRRLGRYQIHQEVGRGGMARVYRATDTLLQRPVALKLLAPHLSDDPEFAKRFEREAITAANLRHPGIITIFDVGQVDGFHYIAMEYIAGCTLHDIIANRGKLGLPLSVALLAPVADALHYAHTRGAIHRDVKPHNILIDMDGRVLLTDFGIALGPRASADRLTQAGSFMGTPEYLSPEQVQEQPLSGRCDQYALAVVAFETLTGRVPFQGATPQLIMAHAYTPPPRVTSLDPFLPPEIDAVLSQALAKDPATRYSTVVAFVETLRTVSNRHGLPPVGVSAVADLARPSGSSAGQDTIAISLAAASAPVAAPPRPPAQQPAFPIAEVFGRPDAAGGAAPRPAIAPSPTPQSAPQPTPPQAAQSPVASTVQPPQAAQRPSRRFTSRRLIRPWTPPPDTRQPSSAGPLSFVAPWVAVVVVLLIAVSGLFLYQGFRARAELPGHSGGLGAVFAGSPTSSPAEPTAVIVPEATSLPAATPVPPTAEPLTTAAPAVPVETQATVTPELQATVGIVVSGGGATIVFQAGAALNLLDARANTISQLSGNAQPDGPASISPDGTRILFDRLVDGRRQIFRYDRASGTTEQFVPGDDEAFHPSWSPDGSHVVYAALHDGNTDIYELDVGSGNIERLTDDPGEDDYPSYSGGGSEVVWERRRAEGWRIFSMNRDGERRIVEPVTGADDRYPRVSPDGNRLVFASSRARNDGSMDLYVMALDGGAPVLLTNARNGSVQGPQWSPDGQMLVFFGNPAGNDDIFTLPLSDPTRITPMTYTSENERWPAWGP